MEKGILQALLIYFIGFGTAWLIYLIYGHPYIHAPGFHHLMIGLTLFVGFFWMLSAIFYFFFKKKSTKLKSFIISNLIILFCFIFYLTYTLLEVNNNDRLKDNHSKNEIKMESKGDTTYVYHNKNIVYIKVKDSILLNLIENIKLEE